MYVFIIRFYCTDLYKYDHLIFSVSLFFIQTLKITKFNWSFWFLINSWNNWDWKTSTSFGQNHQIICNTCESKLVFWVVLKEWGGSFYCLQFHMKVIDWQLMFKLPNQDVCYLGHFNGYLENWKIAMP